MTLPPIPPIGRRSRQAELRAQPAPRARQVWAPPGLTVRRDQPVQQERQARARVLLRDQVVLGHVNGWHVWLSLPGRLRATALSEQLAAGGVLVSPSAAYGVGAVPYEGAIRIALGGERDFTRVEEGITQVIGFL